MAALGVSLAQLRVREDTVPVPLPLVERFQSMVERRASGEPLQYVLGWVPFCEIELAVGPGVLIPRSETEVLVDEISRWIRGRDEARPRQTAGPASGRRSALPAGRSAGAPWIVDVGTGSGAIALALRHRHPHWRVLGIDRSREALDYARRNDRGRERWVIGDLAGAIGHHRATVVVANLPYIPSGEVPGLSRDVRDHEPGIALDGGPDGLVFVRALCLQASQVLAPGGLLALELALGQPQRVAVLLASHGFSDVRIYADLTGRARGVLATQPEAAVNR